MDTMETMITREQLQSAIYLCNSQEEHVETLQLTLSSYPEDWQPRATLWCLIALQKLQQNAVTLDGLLEQVDEGKTVEQGIPPTPVEYIRLLALEKHKEKLGNTIKRFIKAVDTGDAELVDLLLQDPRVDPSVRANGAIRYASTVGYLSVVERLLQDPRVDPSASGNWPILQASQNGHLAVVDRLLQKSCVDPSVCNNYAIRHASGYGHLAVVDRLLQDSRVDPSADNNYAIRLASTCGHLAVVDRLLQDPRVDGSVIQTTA
jgi:hypothetical protein